MGPLNYAKTEAEHRLFFFQVDQELCPPDPRTSQARGNPLSSPDFITNRYLVSSTRDGCQRRLVLRDVQNRVKAGQCNALIMTTFFPLCPHHRADSPGPDNLRTVHADGTLHVLAHLQLRGYPFGEVSSFIVD